MEILEITETKYTPYIRLDAQQRSLVIRGISRPENTVEFYQPVLQWLDDFLAEERKKEGELDPLDLEINMDYFNSISAKYIMGIILKCKQIYPGGDGLRVDWYYRENDDEAREWGVDLGAIAGVEFNLVQKH